MDPSNIAFSICIPAYNARRWISETLESVRNQTHSHWEIIVVDDASPEPCRDLVDAFAATVSQRVTYIAAVTNAGTAATRQRAIDHAAHPHLAFLDADDLWRPQHLSALARSFCHDQAEFVFSGASMFTTSPKQQTAILAPQSEHLADLRSAFFFCRFWIQPSTIGLHRRMLDRTGPWQAGLEAKPAWLPNPNIAEDRNFCLRVIHQGITPVWTGEVTVDYRKHTASTTHHTREFKVDRVWFYNRYGLLRDKPAWPQRRYLGYLNRMAGDHLRDTDPRHAAWYYWHAWTWYPLRPERLFQALRHWLRSRLKSATEPCI